MRRYDQRDRLNGWLGARCVLLIITIRAASGSGGCRQIAASANPNAVVSAATPSATVMMMAELVSRDLNALRKSCAESIDCSGLGCASDAGQHAAATSTAAGVTVHTASLTNSTHSPNRRNDSANELFPRLFTADVSISRRPGRVPARRPATPR